MNKKQAYVLALDFAWQALETDNAVIVWEQWLSGQLDRPVSDKEVVKLQDAMGDVIQMLRRKYSTQASVLESLKQAQENENV